MDKLLEKVISNQYNANAAKPGDSFYFRVSSATKKKEEVSPSVILLAKEIAKVCVATDVQGTLAKLQDEQCDILSKNGMVILLKASVTKPTTKIIFEPKGIIRVVQEPLSTKRKMVHSHHDAENSGGSYQINSSKPVGEFLTGFLKKVAADCIGRLKDYGSLVQLLRNPKFYNNSSDLFQNLSDLNVTIQFGTAGTRGFLQFLDNQVSYYLSFETLKDKRAPIFSIQSSIIDWPVTTAQKWARQGLDHPDYQKRLEEARKSSVGKDIVFQPVFELKKVVSGLPEELVKVATEVVKVLNSTPPHLREKVLEKFPKDIKSLFIPFRSSGLDHFGSVVKVKKTPAKHETKLEKPEELTKNPENSTLTEEEESTLLSALTDYSVEPTAPVKDLFQEKRKELYEKYKDKKSFKKFPKDIKDFLSGQV